MEPLQFKPDEKVLYDPAQLGLRPDIDEEHDALVDLSEGDAFLLGHYMALAEVEKAYGEGTMDLTAYHSLRDDAQSRISQRRYDLGLSPDQ